MTAIDAETIARQREWSTQTFGPGKRTGGVTQHIEKELDEIRDDPDSLEEWIDVMILAVDGAWRTGAAPAEILSAYHGKLTRNFARRWPDWQSMSEDEAIEHVRDTA